MIYHLSKKDFWSATVTGLYTGLIAWFIAGFLHLPLLAGFSYAWAILVMPLAWIVGVWLGYWLGRWFTFFNQFGKFVAIGFTNFAVDLAGLNILISLTGLTQGSGYAMIRLLAAIVAVLHSYFWNRRWVFDSQRNDVGRELGSFAIAAVIAALINVGAAYLVVNFIHPLAGLTPERWANVAAIVGSATALIVNFVILRQKVFNKGR